MKTRRYVYTVASQRRFTAFPADMLRYDSAWPASPAAVDTIFAEVKDRPEQGARVRLISVQKPTAARWNSFGWNVSEVEEVV